MKISSSKAKGRLLQKEVVMALRQKYVFDVTQGDNCYEGDITARVLGATGTDIILSPTAKMNIPFNIECKNKEALNIWSALKQTEANAEEGRIPLLVFRRNRSETYCCLKLSDLLKVIP